MYLHKNIKHPHKFFYTDFNIKINVRQRISRKYVPKILPWIYNHSLTEGTTYITITINCKMAQIHLYYIKHNKLK